MEAYRTGMGLWVHCMWSGGRILPAGRAGCCQL